MTIKYFRFDTTNVFLQGGVSRIDQVARFAFPLAFFFFNGMYWFIYLSHQSHEVAYRMEPKLEY